MARARSFLKDSGEEMKSMTGYGSHEGNVGSGRMFIEIKSVNHRYADIFLKIPPKMNPLDPLIRKLLQTKIERGKIEFFLKEKRDVAAVKDLSLDIALAKKYHKCLQRLQRELGIAKKDVHLLELVDAHEFITVADLSVDYSKYWNPMKKMILVALTKLDKMRAKEGAFLLRDQSLRVQKLRGLVNQVSRQAMTALRAYRTRLKKELAESGDAPVVLTERVDSVVETLAEKIDITEEITRLKSHLNQYRQILRQKGSLGRKLDFLLQEMNREVNTLSAKSGDVIISRYVVDIKSELEKLREQIQNIE